LQEAIGEQVVNCTLCHRDGMWATDYCVTLCGCEYRLNDFEYKLEDGEENDGQRKYDVYAVVGVCEGDFCNGGILSKEEEEE